MSYDDYEHGDPPPPPPPPPPGDRERRAARGRNDWRRSEGDPRREEGEQNGDYRRWRAYLRERLGGAREDRIRGERARGAAAPPPGREYSGGSHSREADDDFASEQAYERYRGNRDWDDRGYAADYPSRYGSEGDPSGFADYDSSYARRPSRDRELGDRGRARRWWGEDSDSEHAYVGPSYRYAGFGVGREHPARRDFAGRGPKNYRRADDRIADDVNEALTRSPYIDATDVEVRVEGGAVTLIGSVDDRGAKRMAEDIAEACFGVLDVSNQLKVGRQRAD